MKKTSQEQVWDNIAPEWHKFKKNPGRGVEDFLKSKKGKILDLGSGSGRNLTKIKDTEIYLVDFSEKMLKLAEKKAKNQRIKIKTQQADITKLPFKDNFFDSAIAIASFHCLNKKQQKKAAKELFRVLKPKSEALIAVWNKESKRFKNSPKEKYVNWRDKGLRYYYLFEEEEIYDLFKKAGFKIKKSCVSPHLERCGLFGFLDTQDSPHTKVCGFPKNLDIKKKIESEVNIVFVAGKS